MPRIILFCLLAQVVLTLNLYAAGNTNSFSINLDILVKTGDASPDGNGVFANTLISPPILNNQSQVLIWSTLVATTDPSTIDDFGFYRLSRQNRITLVRGGDMAPTGEIINLSPQALTANLNRFSQQGLSEDGSIRFALIRNNGTVAIHAANDTELLTLLESGQVTDFTDDLQLFANFFLVNDTGQSSFLTLTQAFAQAIVDEDSARLLITPGASLPNGRIANGSLFTSLVGGLNNQGQAALPVTTNATPPNNAGFYLSDGTQIDQIIHLGEPAVDGLGTYTTQLGMSSVSDSGTAVLTQLVDDINNDYTGLFFYNGNNLEEWTRTGNSIQGEGPLTTINGSLYVNDNDSGLFSGQLLRDAGVPVESVFYRANDVNKRIISDFEQLPAPIDLEVRGPFSYVLNTQDQILIFGFVIAEGLSRQAIFLYDPIDGLALVARTGMTLNGDTVTALDMALPPFSGLGNLNSTNAMNSFNDQGEVAFSYALQNGEIGIVLATVEFVDEGFLFADGFEN